MNTEQQGRLEIYLQIQKDLLKVLDEDKYLGGRIGTLFREQCITIISILTDLSMIISTVALAVTGSFRGGSPADCGSSSTKYEDDVNN